MDKIATTPININAQIQKDSPSFVINPTDSITKLNLGDIDKRESGSAFALGAALSSPRSFDSEPYTKYMNGVNSNVGIDALNNLRSLNQSNWDRAGNAFVQLLGTIGGGTITGIGSALNFPEVVYTQMSNLLDGNTMDSWDDIVHKGLTGGLAEYGIALETAAREEFPIWQTSVSEEGGFQAMGDASWWASRFPTVGSAVSSMIPVIGELKVLNWAGKLAMMSSNVSKGGKLLNAAGRLITNQKFQTIYGAVKGAHLDSMEEIVRGYDEQLDYAKSLGFTDEEAKQFAGIYASTAYNDAWMYGFVFNAIELNTILKGMKKGQMAIPDVDRLTRRNITDMARQGRKFTGMTYDAALEAGDDITKAAWKRTLRNTLGASKDYLKVGIAEGLEEMRVDYALEEGEIAAKKKFDIYDPRENLSHVEKISDFVTSNSSWDSFIWGAFGGLTMYGGRSLINKALNGKSMNDFAVRQYQSINDALQQTANILQDYNGDLSFKPNIETVTNEDGSVSEKITSIEDPAQSIFVPLFNTLGQANAIEYGEAYLNEVLNMPNEEIKELYGENKKPLIQSILQEFKKAREIYNKNRNVSFGSKFDTYIQNNISTIDYLSDYYNRQFDVINTDLQKRKIEYDNRDEIRDSQLKLIDSKRFAIEQEQKNINEEIKLLKELEKQSNSIETDTNILNKIESIETENKHIKDKIKSIKSDRSVYGSLIRDNIRKYKTLSKDINNSENNLERDSKIKELNALYDEHIELKDLLFKTSNEIKELNKGKSENEFSIEYANKEIQFESLKKKLNGVKIENLTKKLNILDSSLKELKDKENNTNKEYNDIVEEFKGSPGVDNITISNLERIKKDLLLNIVELTNIQENKKEYANKLNEVYSNIEEYNDKLEKEDKTFDSEIEKEDSYISDLDIELINSNIETKKDKNNINYLVNKDNVITSFIHDNKKYDIGSKFNDIEIYSISIDENNSLNIFDKNNNKTVLENIKKEDIVDPILDSIYSFASTFSIDKFGKDFFKTLDKLSKTIKGKVFKKAFIETNRDSKISLDRFNTISGLIKTIGTNIPTEKVTDVQNKQIESILKTLNEILNISHSAYTYNQVYNYINDYFDFVLSDKSSDINNEFNNKYKPLLIKTLNDYISKLGNFNIDTKSIDITRIYGLEEIKLNIDNIFKEFKSVLENQFYTKYELESFSDLEENLDNSILSLQSNIETSFRKTLNTVIDLQLKEINTWINNINNQRKDKNNILNTYVSETLKINDILEFAKQLSDILNNYKDTTTIPTQEVYKEISDLYNKINDILNKPSIELIDSSIYNNVDKTGIFILTNQLNDIYKFFSSYIAAYNESSLNEDTALYSIDVFAKTGDNTFEFESDESLVGNDIFDKTDYRFYITPSDVIAFKALDDIISRFNLLNKYKPNHKISYNDILDMIYNGKDGTTQLEKLYEPVWNALKNIANYDKIQELKQRIKNNVPEAQTTEIFRILSNIRDKVRQPLGSIDNKFVDGNGNIRTSYLNEFKKTHKQYAWQQEVKEGVIVPNNKIWSALNDVYNHQMKTIASSVEINGETFTTNELIEALQSLKTGQELLHELSSNGDKIVLYTTINDKKLEVGSISIIDNYKFGNLNISRKLDNTINYNNEINLNDTYIYNSFLGTSDGLSVITERLISQVGNSQKLFDSIKEYYKSYYKYQTKGQLNSEEAINELNNLLHEIGEVNKKDGTEHNLAYNGILNMSNYNSEFEGTETINHSRIHTVIEPIFYNVDIENIDDYLRWSNRIRNTYENLNAKLAMSFNYTQALKNHLEENPNSIVKISSINKTGISYASTKKYRNNVLDNIKADIEIEINGKKEKAINIVSNQKKGTTEIVSSLTSNESINTDFAENVILDSDRHFQFSAEVRSNSNEDGVSYIPLKRGNLSYSTSQNGYDKVFTEFIKHNISSILSDRFLTSLSTKESSNKKISTFVASERFKDSKNKQYSNILNDMGDVIIIDSNKDNNTIPWFNVSNLYINRKLVAGQIAGMEMSKDIEFISVTRGQKTSYGYKIRVVYEYNDNIDDNSKIKRIEVQRFRTKSDRSRGDAQPGFTANQLGKLYGEDATKYSQDIKYNKSVIFINESNNINKVLNSGIFNEIFGNMQRAMPTTYNNNSFTYTAKGTGESFGSSFNKIDGTNVIESTGYDNKNKGKVFKSSYTSPALVWGKKNNIYNGDTSFKSLQEYYLKTDALTTGAVGIKNETTNEVVTNYQLQSVTPRLYVTIDKPSVLEIKPKVTINSLQEAKGLINTVSSPKSNTDNNFYKSLESNGSTIRNSFEALGIIPNYFTKSLSNEIIKFYKDTYGDVDKIPMLLIDNKKDYKDKTGIDLKEDYKTLKGEYNSKLNAIILFNNIFDKGTSTIEDLGNLINHETLHFRIKKDIENGNISKNIKIELDDLINKIERFTDDNIELTIDEVNSKNLLSKEDIDNVKSYMKAIKDANNMAYSELISYGLTDSTFANLLNKIEVLNPITSQKQSLWNKLIDVLLSIIGIVNVNNNSVLGQLKNIITNNINSGSKVINQSNNFTTPSALSGLEQVETEITTVEQNDGIIDIESIDIDIETMDNTLFGNDDESLYSKDLIVASPSRHTGDAKFTSNSNKNNLSNALKGIDNSVSLDIVKSIKDNYIDNDNLKIC